MKLAFVVFVFFRLFPLLRLCDKDSQEQGKCKSEIRAWNPFQPLGFSLSRTNFMVHVKTGDLKGAGTDANVWLVLYDVFGNTSKETKLNSLLHNDHERGETSSYGISEADGLKGRIVKLEFWRDKFGIGDDWHVEIIHVENKLRKETYYFPIHRWIKPNVKYTFAEFDACLPQFDIHRDQRDDELQEKKEQYQYVMNVEGGPSQIKNLSDDETFSDSYKWDIGSQKLKLLAQSTLIKFQTEDSWKSLDELKSIYKFSFGKPQCLSHWKEDWWFGLQRLQGCNPVMIHLCKEIPEKFGVTGSMVEPFLDGMSLQEALDKNKLFIVDMKLLDGVKCKDDRVLCSPIALFYLDKQNTFLPIAIQLFQKCGPENPIFLPSDPPYTWLLAKMYYNGADAAYHESLTHLGYTHLMMEGIVVCTHRNLSPSHPLFKLMAPHFLYLLAINTRALGALLSPNGWVDKSMTIDRDGMLAIVVKGFQEWKMNIHGMIPNDLESRKVLDPEILPYYPYRDDALPLFNYSLEKIINDHELQSWRAELARPKMDGGVGVLGVPGDDENGITNTNQIIDMVTAVISSCSIAHAATNFPQYDEYAFPPNYPALLMGEIPKDKRARTEQDIVAHIPNKQIILNSMVLSKLLSTKGTKSLGDFEVQYLYDPVSIKAAKEFRKELNEISKIIKARNANRIMPYPWLDPVNVPNAISI